jgi:hypothetical protein
MDRNPSRRVPRRGEVQVIRDQAAMVSDGTGVRERKGSVITSTNMKKDPAGQGMRTQDTREGRSE